MSERRAVSCGVNPKIHGPQMQKHTQLGKYKLILETVQWFWLIKQKSFVLKNDHWWNKMTVGFSHLAFACVRESVRTRGIGSGESYSQPWHVDIRVGMCIFLLECVCV